MLHAQTTPVANFTIEYLQFLDAQHQLTQALPEFATADVLLSLYRQMVLLRLFDKKAVNLQRMGKLGTYPSSRGEEAVNVGIGHALQPDDIYCPAYRSQGVMLARGIKMREILAFWGGDERGNCFENNQHDLPICITVAGQCIHAAGVAFAVKYREQARAVVVQIGDGGTSKGDFYEALNLAGVWQLPLVVIICNNQWAISVPRTRQTAAQTLAQKAIAAGIEGLQVDGNDIIAVRHAVDYANNKARSGGGPSVIEAVTYRLADHTTADDASRYRSEQELKAAWEQEPIARLAYYLEAQKLWSKEQETNLQLTCEAEVDQAVAEYLHSEPAPTTDMFDYLYAQLPIALVDQRNALIATTQSAQTTGEAS